MKSHVLMSTAIGKVELCERDVPNPAAGEIQVGVHTSVISHGTERAFVLGLDNTPGVYPLQLGYSAAGIVEKIGDGVQSFKPGDHVACRLNHCSIGNIHMNDAILLPDHLPFEYAAFTGLGVIALQGVRKLRIELGECAMSLGMGIVGQLALQLAGLNGAVPTIAVDKVTSRLQIASDSGIHHVLDATMADWRAQLYEITNGQGPDVVIESTGFPDAVNQAFEVVRPFGRVALLASTRGESVVNFYKSVHKKAITIIGAHVDGNPLQDSRPGSWTWFDDARTFVRLLERDRLKLDKLITHRVHYQNVGAVYDEILSWNSEVLGSIIAWTDDEQASGFLLK